MGILSDFIYAALILATIYFFLELRKYYVLKKLHSHMKWIFSNEERGQSLQDYIYDHVDEMDSEYWFDVDINKNIIKTILDGYKEHLISLFYSGSFNENKVYINFSDESFYLMTLFSYLEKHSCDSKYHSHSKDSFFEMRSFKSKESYYDSYNFTDFGMVYTKFYHMVCLICEQKQETKKYVSHGASDKIKENIQSGTIGIINYRP